MSHCSNTAKQSLALICDTLMPFEFAAIAWRGFDHGLVAILARTPEERFAIAERLGLGPADLGADGRNAEHSGIYADIPVTVYSSPSRDEVTAWALARVAVTS